ncbi:unnamed protein product [Phytophthora fragariaefolia]|uniref:Unnamed protein product n=1 Tax=Phytophthora fragariaefolia TaxID=1490495 RepID=A0A9W7CUD2_9STRA|nr:unnamed protein product [Phytophthora fragariaefolia]
MQVTCSTLEAHCALQRVALKTKLIMHVHAGLSVAGCTRPIAEAGAGVDAGSGTGTGSSVDASVVAGAGVDAGIDTGSGVDVGVVAGAGV